MDYHDVHDHDIASFDVPGTHRLPTVTAAQALEELQEDGAVRISTGVASLDRALVGLETAGAGEERRKGGIKGGQVTEIWGPPGTGKTALAIQMASHAIVDGGQVVWVDCFHRLDEQRLGRVLASVKGQKGADDKAGDHLANFIHYSCLTLAHLMALLAWPAVQSMGAANLSLVVISMPSALLNSSLVRASDGKTEGGGRNGIQGPTASSKRLQGLQYLMNALQQLAATRNCAVVVLSQSATRMHSGLGPTLVAAVDATVWEEGISTRLALFRDWDWRGGRPISTFSVGLQKVDGRRWRRGMKEEALAFKVERSGASDLEGHYWGHHRGHHRSHHRDDHRGHHRGHSEARTRAGATGTAAGQKRKLEEARLVEVPDSEDDDDDDEGEQYGWTDGDEAALPPLPPQWQGSEDILLGRRMGEGSDGDEAEAEAEAEDGAKDGAETCEGGARELAAGAGLGPDG